MKTVFTYLLTNMPKCSRCEGLEKLGKLQDKLDNMADSITSSFYLEECNNNRKYYKQLTARECKCVELGFEEEMEVYVIDVILEGSNTSKEYFCNEETGYVFEANYSLSSVEPNPKVLGIMIPEEREAVAKPRHYFSYNDILWN